LKREIETLKQEISKLKHENETLVQKWAESNKAWNTQKSMISNQYMVII